jgi:hypothetical protein
MKPTTYEEKLAALAEILPERIIALIKGRFEAILSSWKVNNIYNRAYPEYANRNAANQLYLNDNLNTHLNEVEAQLWNRACLELDNWLYDAFVESPQANGLAPEED